MTIGRVAVDGADAPPVGGAGVDDRTGGGPGGRSTPRFIRIFEYQFVLYRAVWRGSIVTTLVTPVLYLLAMGIGVGRLVDDDPSEALGGLTYLEFVAPGLLAAGAMQLAANQSLYPVLASVKWLRTAFAQVATPVRPQDLVLGLHSWLAARLMFNASIFALVMAIAGAVASPWILLTPFAAAVGGLAHAAPLSAWAIGREGDLHFTLVVRFVILPMFLLSGVFFPVEQLPTVLEVLAKATPLWHTVELVRSMSDGSFSAGLAARHVPVPAGYYLVGLVAGVDQYRKRLHS